MSPHTRHDPAAPTGAEATTLYVAIEISRKSWVRAARRDRCQHVPTRQHQTPDRSTGGGLTML